MRGMQATSILEDAFVGLGALEGSTVYGCYLG